MLRVALTAALISHVPSVTVVVEPNQQALGLTLQFNASADGALVLNVSADGPAATVLNPGDKIQQIDGNDITGLSIVDARRFLQPSGDGAISLTIIRDDVDRNDDSSGTCSQSPAVDLSVLDALLSNRGTETKLCDSDSYWGVDQVAVINLDRRADRWEQFVERSSNLGHDSPCVWRFSGFDGRNSPVSDGLKRIFEGNDFYYHPGVMGATLSHLAGM
jgi:hypothetical protein